MKKQFKTINEYIETFPEDVRIILEKVRQTIREALPEAEKTISYQIPTFKLKDKYSVYFAAYKNHISVYPVPSGTESFEKELSPYLKGKGTIQIALDKPIPYELVKKIALAHLTHRLAENKYLP